jgi:spermidine/putrescine transport system permease protein
MQTPTAVLPQQSKQLKLGPLVVLPAGLWLGVFMLVPLAIILVFSFGLRDASGHVVLSFQPDNYARFFTGPYMTCLGRSLLLAGSTTVLCLLIGFPCALWLSMSVPKEKQNLFMTLLTVPLWISFLLRIYAWIIILRPTGLITQTFQSIGLQPPPSILYTSAAVLLGMVYNYLPYIILPLYSTLEKLDRRLIEASQDLGATGWTTFTKVIVPLSQRGIVAGIIMVFVPSLGDYITPDLMGGAKTMYIGSLIQNQFLVVRDWAFGSAVSTILLIIVGFGIYLYLRYGETPTTRH